MAAIGIALAAAVGAAAAAGIDGATTTGLGSGGAGVTSCDPDGVTLAQTTSGSTLTAVVVESVHADCAGAELFVTLAQGDGTEVGTAGPETVPGGGGDVSLTVVPGTVDLADFDDHHLRITGP